MPLLGEGGASDPNRCAEARGGAHQLRGRGQNPEVSPGRARPFRTGTPVVWRSRPAGEVGYVFACRVVRDDSHVQAVLQQTGARIATRTGVRGGPRGRSLHPGTWDGARQLSSWARPPAVRLHPVGRAYSVIRTWMPAQQRFRGWYINLEQPWRRTRIGFDSRDDILDIVADDDLRAPRLKDEDELEFAVSVGKLDRDDADAVRTIAALALNDIGQRRWPFNDQAWPPITLSLGEPPDLPSGWDDL